MSDAAASPPPTNATLKRLRERVATWSDMSAPDEMVEKAKKALKSRKSKRDATSRNKAYRAIADQLPDDDPVTWFQLSVGVMGEVGCWATSRGCEVRELLDWIDECLLLMGDGEELTSDRGRQWRTIKLGSTFERDLANVIDQILSGEGQSAPEAEAEPAPEAASTSDAQASPDEEAGIENGPDDVPTPVDSGSPEDVPTPDPAPDTATSGALETPTASGDAAAPASEAPPAPAPEPEPVTPEPDPAPDVDPGDDATEDPSAEADGEKRQTP